VTLPAPEVAPESVTTAVPEQQPTSAQPPATTPAPFSIDALSSSNWYEGRSALLEQLLNRARQFHQDNLTRVEIGTMASIETLTAETVVVNLSAAIELAKGRVGSAPSDAEVAIIRQRYLIALRSIDDELARFGAGMQTGRIVAAAFLEASNLLIHASVTDADLIDALRRLATSGGPGDRANALVSIAEHYALTPEMVTFYATAADSIVSAPDRERVFAHPIRIKPSATGQ